MKIEDNGSDALEIIKDIHQEMKVVRDLLAELEYVVYRCDERCKIEFFGRGKNDEGRSEERIKTY